jgi:methylase of polypeptide subunit release factors
MRAPTDADQVHARCAAFPVTGPFRPARPGDFSLLRERFRAAGFTETSVGEVLEGKSDRNIDMAYVIRRTAEPSPFHSLVRLFLLGIPVVMENAVAALSRLGIQCALETGLIEDVGNSVRAIACLRPWREFFLLGDFLPPRGEPLPSDFVMSGTSASSRLLTRLTIRRRVAKALDLGTGAGTHALLAASHADQVIATDTSKRALNFAAMNARLNGIDNVSFAEGSFFDPVAGEKFDLIVTNPPFIISPQSGLMFQNAELEGDQVSELIVRESAAYLREGAFAVSLISWVHETEEDWASRPCAWVKRSGCDFWLLRATSQNPLSYAAGSLRQTEFIGSRRYSELLDKWLEFDREQGFVRLALGAAILRKRVSGRNWIHCEDLSGAVITSEASEQIERVFAAEDFLATANEEELLDICVTIHPDHVLEQELVAKDDGWMSQSLTLRPAVGIEHRAAIDPQVLAFLSRCDGTRTVRQLISDVAHNNGVDFAAASAAGLALVRRLLRAGFLVVESGRTVTKEHVRAAPSAAT